jgi:hypothetical protein
MYSLPPLCIEQQSKKILTLSVRGEERESNQLLCELGIIDGGRWMAGRGREGKELMSDVKTTLSPFLIFYFILLSTNLIN